MSFGNIQRLQHYRPKNALALVWPSALPLRQHSLWPWLIVGVVGVTLGIAVLGLAFLPLRWASLLALGSLGLFIAIVVGNVRRLFLAAAIIDIPLGLDIHFAYRPALAELNAVAGFNVSITTICLAVLYALWLGELLSKRRPQIHSSNWMAMTLPLTAYMLVTIMSVAVAGDVMLSLYELALLLQIFLLYLYVVGTVRTRQDVLFIVKILLASLLVESVVMIGLRFVGTTIEIAGITARVDGGTRVGGTVGSPNAAAGYLALFLSLTVGVLLARLGRSYKWLAVLAFGLGGIALIFTLSRGGWNAFVVSMVILYLLAWWRGLLSRNILVIAAILLVLAILFQDTILVRLFSGEGSTAETRLRMMRMAIEIIKDHPWLGVGANNYAIMIPQYDTPDFAGWLHVVHNKYLLVWAETGLVGLMAFLLFLITTIRRGWQSWRLNDALLSPLAIGLTAGIVGQMSHMFLDLFHSRPLVQGLWLAAGLIMAIGNIISEQSPDPDSNRSYAAPSSSGSLLSEQVKVIK
jgi:O-antigen ligase